MTFREIRDHKFKIIFMSNILQEDIEECFLRYFENIPFEDEENVNTYVSNKKTSHTNIHSIEISAKEEIKNVSDSAIEINVDELAHIEDIKNKVRDIISKTEKINEIIKTSLDKSWDMHRLGKAEITIIRLAIYEMYFDASIDLKVAINEAVELAKVYGDDKADKFVNGVLATIYKNYEKSNNSITT